MKTRTFVRVTPATLRKNGRKAFPSGSLLLAEIKNGLVQWQGMLYHPNQVIGKISAIIK